MQPPQALGKTLEDGVIAIVQQLADKDTLGKQRLRGKTCTLAPTQEAVLAVAFSADCQWFAYGGNDNFCTMRRADGLAPARLTPKGAQVTSVLLSRDGRRCITADYAGAVAIYSNPVVVPMLLTMEPLELDRPTWSYKSSGGAVQCMALCDSDRVLVLGGDGKQLEVFDVKFALPRDANERQPENQEDRVTLRSVHLGLPW